jgi:hypothetical protein
MVKEGYKKKKRGMETYSKGTYASSIATHGFWMPILSDFSFTSSTYSPKGEFYGVSILFGVYVHKLLSILLWYSLD